MAYSNTTSSVEKYPYPWEVNVLDFVPDKLSDAKCYPEWKQLMLDFIESQGLLGFVDGGTTEAASKRVSQAASSNSVSWRRSDNLVRGWILTTLDKDTRLQVLRYTTASGVWTRLVDMFDRAKNRFQLDEETDKKKRRYLPLRIAAIEDIALTLLQLKPELACMEPSVLNVLVEKWSSFRSGTSLNFWQILIYSGIPVKSEHIANRHSGARGNIVKPNNCCIFGWGITILLLKIIPQIKNIREKKLVHHHVLQLLKFLCVEIEKLSFSKVQSIFGPALLSATYAGIHEIVEEIIVLYPFGMESRNELDGTLFHYAIMWRRERVFNLIYQLDAGWRYLTILDKSGNNGLHLAGCLRPQQKLNLRDSVAGPVLQMQRELQWFKEVEKLAKPGDKDVRNTDGMTPAEVFTDSHQQLVKEGEQWMKDTATSCTTVATLIAIFAAAVIILGRNNNNDGHPLLSKQKSFIVFGIFDTLALFSSMTSALMFLLILISRYASDDFLYALPKRLIIGFTTLFISMLCTIVAFGAVLQLLFGDDKGWVLFPVVALASLPVTLFGTLHFPLLVQMIQSTYGRGLFGEQPINVPRNQLPSMAYSSTTSSVEKYPYPWDVNVLDFVPDKLSDAKCYPEWKQLMVDFIKSQGLLGFVDGSTTEAASKRVSQAASSNSVSWRRSDNLVRGWILTTLDKDTRLQVLRYTTARGVWTRLVDMFDRAKNRFQLDEETEKKLSRYLPLRIAAIEGDWDTTSKIIESKPDIVRAAITPYLETALFLAVKSPRRNHFVEKILKKMSPEDAGLANLAGMTALHRAASVGNVEAAKLLVDKNPNLPNVLDEYGDPPLNYAASTGSRESVVYLWEVTKEEVKLKDNVAAELLRDLTRGEHYDIALTLLQCKPELACMEPSVLNVLVEKCSSFRSGTSLNFWQSLIYSVRQRFHSMFWEVAEKFVPQIKNIREKKLIHHHALQLLKFLCVEIAKLNFSKVQSICGPALLSATYAGIHEIVEEILVLYPLGMDSRNEVDGTLFHYAIMWRRERVFNLIYQLEAGRRYLQILDKSRNNGLHLAGCLRPQQKLNLRDGVAGAVLQMQRELQWFKEVEKLSTPGDKDVRNTDGMTPAEVFTDSHQQLVKEGEQWMKDTATSCTTVATLIAIMVFAAALIILGRNNNDDGHTLLSQQKGFMVFGIFDTLALFSSMTSVLMFLLILISRYASEDFLYAVPKRLIIGLTTLFVSILSMMVAFGAILYLLFGDDKGWVLIPIVVLASLPVTLFGTMHFPLLVQMIQSTYGRGLFGKQSDRMLW
ncbi:hypothetical protein RHMOL_Rhmol02G0295600 [Rhododendron molle]|nr:hypothetical protein RHMOL_Rhmol02G0295600 [Rhododendron molle]